MDIHHLAQTAVQSFTAAQSSNGIERNTSDSEASSGANSGCGNLRTASITRLVRVTRVEAIINVPFQFRKFDDREHAPLAEEYPDENSFQYYYDPKPMKPIPPIAIYEFNRRFNTCYRPRPHLHLLHKCKPLCVSRELLVLFPQRDSELEEGGDAREEFW